VKVETVQQQKDLKKMAAAGGKASRSLKKAVVKHPAYASWGSVVNAQVKAKLTPSSKCNLGKFLGIRDPPASDISQLITRFIKLNNRQVSIYCHYPLLVLLEIAIGMLPENVLFDGLAYISCK